MKWITLNEFGGKPELTNPIEINVDLIFSLKAKGQPNEGTIINGAVTVREDIDTIRAACKPKAKKPSY